MNYPRIIVYGIISVLGAATVFFIMQDSFSVPPHAYRDSFHTDLKLEESNSASSTAPAPWRLSSGAQFVVQNGIGQTLQNDLDPTSPWYRAYAESNPVDTDGGMHPQNIFRLQTTDTWKNFTQQAYFRIGRINLSDSPNRNSSNGLFFFNRAKDPNNLYYTGLRVDGAAVIKKKMNGEYMTLVEKKLFDGEYDPMDTPNLLPQHTWIGLKSEVQDAAGGKVRIRLFIADQTGNWKLVAETTDTSDPIFREAGYAGIRTDFMNVSFEAYSIDGN